MSWKNNPTNFGLEVVQKAESQIKKISAEMLQGVIMASPVQDSPYRSNHRVSIDAAINGTVEGTGNTSPKGSMDQETFSDGAKEILKVKLGSCVYIQNNISYALALENGHSDQAPKGVYALTFRYVSEKYR